MTPKNPSKLNGKYPMNSFTFPSRLSSSLQPVFMWNDANNNHKSLPTLTNQHWLFTLFSSFNWQWQGLSSQNCLEQFFLFLKIYLWIIINISNRCPILLTLNLMARKLWSTYSSLEIPKWLFQSPNQSKSSTKRG